jgi:hypothetical protein
MEIGCLHFQVSKLPSQPHLASNGEGSLPPSLCPSCAQGKSLEMNHLDAGTIIIAIITTMHQGVSNASVGQSLLFKECSLLFHLVWSL